MSEVKVSARPWSFLRLQEELVPCISPSFWWFPVFLSLETHCSNLCLHVVCVLMLSSLYVCLCVFPSSFKDTYQNLFKAHPLDGCLLCSAPNGGVFKHVQVFKKQIYPQILQQYFSLRWNLISFPLSMGWSH